MCDLPFTVQSVIPCDTRDSCSVYSFSLPHSTYGMVARASSCALNLIIDE